jgi:hypothetical protein
MAEESKSAPKHTPSHHNNRWYKNHPEVAKLSITDNKKRAVDPPKPPFYQSTLLWGALSIAAAIVLTVVAAMTKDLRWLLIVAWPFFVLAFWELFRTIISAVVLRRVLIIMASFLAALGLFALNSWLSPSLRTLNAPSDHTIPPRKDDQSPARISLSALATNIGYKEKTKVAGVEWSKQYAEVRLVIKSDYQYPMLNLDVIVHMLEPHEVFIGMAQASSITGVEFHQPPRSPMPEIRLRAADGGPDANPGPLMDEQMSKVWKVGRWYRIYCPRVEPEDKLMIIAVTSTSSLGVAPQLLRMEGSYETSPSEGSKRIQFDQTVPVTRP